MANKLKVKDKEYARLGIRKNSNGDFEYINPNDKNKSKYKSVKKSLSIDSFLILETNNRQLVNM